MINNITLQGRFTKDPELRYTNSQISVCSFTLACERDIAGQDGKRECDFIDCVAWRSTADFISKYFSKGSLAAVTGRLQVRSWKDDNGNNRRTSEILVDHVYFCGSSNGTSGQTSGKDDFVAVEDDGELPF